MLSIDGKIHKDNLFVAFGEDFPKRYSNREFILPNGDEALVYILGVGFPMWRQNGDKFGVIMPVEYIISKIIKKASAELEHEAERIAKAALLKRLNEQLDDALLQKDFAKAKELHDQMQQLKAYYDERS
ncbi:hypothetical protein SAMN05421868_10748 [Paenibacillus naphthalenovorans]|nr:hypothetical protein SAMN05421868_10748 [Paenibacillus naphthalenovorans]